MVLYLVEVNKKEETIKDVQNFDCEYEYKNQEDAYNAARKYLAEVQACHKDRDFRVIKEEDREKLFEEVFDNKTKKMWEIYTEEFDDPYCAPYISSIGTLNSTHYEAEMYCYKWNEALHKSEEYGMRDMSLKCSEFIPLEELTLDTPPLEDIK